MHGVTVSSLVTPQSPPQYCGERQWQALDDGQQVSDVLAQTFVVLFQSQRHLPKQGGDVVVWAQDAVSSGTSPVTTKITAPGGTAKQWGVVVVVVVVDVPAPVVVLVVDVLLVEVLVVQWVVDVFVVVLVVVVATACRRATYRFPVTRHSSFGPMAQQYPRSRSHVLFEEL